MIDLSFIQLANNYESQKDYKYLKIIKVFKNEKLFKKTKISRIIFIFNFFKFWNIFRKLNCFNNIIIIKFQNFENFKNLIVFFWKWEFPKKMFPKWPSTKLLHSDGNLISIITWCSYSAKIKLQYMKNTFHVAHFHIN